MIAILTLLRQPTPAEQLQRLLANIEFLIETTRANRIDVEELAERFRFIPEFITDWVLLKRTAIEIGGMEARLIRFQSHIQAFVIAKLRERAAELESQLLAS